jgi:carboxyl-terminal processing protease
MSDPDRIAAPVRVAGSETLSKQMTSETPDPYQIAPAQPRRLPIGLVGALALLLAGCGQAALAVEPYSSTTPVAVVAAATIVVEAGTPVMRAPPAPTPITPPPVPTPVAPRQTHAPAPPTPIAAIVRQQIFDEIWTTVDQHHLYAADPALNWPAIRDEYAVQLNDPPDNEAFYALLGAMVARLNDNHSRLLPPTAAQQEDLRTTGRAEQVGIGVLTLQMADGLMVQHVFPDGPAARAGLRTRDRIVAIDGAPFTQGSLEGAAGSQVRLMIQRPGDAIRDVALMRKAVIGQITPTVQRLEGNIGYLGLSTLWVGDMADQAATALAAMEAEAPLRGIIIDLRSNPGGWRNVLTSLLGHFVQGPVGEFFSRTERLPLEVSSPSTPDLRGRPIVVLIDEGTASYAEVLAGILQYEAGAIVVGMPSAGNTETIYAHELTGGGRLWVAQEGFRLRNGTNLEGVGVQPNMLIADDWTRYSEAEDPGIMLGISLLTNPAGK